MQSKKLKISLEMIHKTVSTEFGQKNLLMDER